jgi:hypothetical protein
MRSCPIDARDSPIDDGATLGVGELTLLLVPLSDATPSTPLLSMNSNRTLSLGKFYSLQAYYIATYITGRRVTFDDEAD